MRILQRLALKSKEPAVLEALVYSQWELKGLMQGNEGENSIHLYHPWKRQLLQMSPKSETRRAFSEHSTCFSTTRQISLADFLAKNALKSYNQP